MTKQSIWDKQNYRVEVLIAKPDHTWFLGQTISYAKNEEEAAAHGVAYLKNQMVKSNYEFVMVVLYAVTLIEASVTPALLDVREDGAHD